MKKLLLLSLFVLLGSKSFAQLTGDNYPVQAYVYVSGAGSLKLSDYFTSSTKLGVDLILKDLTKSSLDVYLSWEIEGLGLGIQAGSTPGYVPSSFITLNRGSIKKIKGIDLREYFQPGVVVAAGVEEAVIFNGSLPEGFYVLRVRAYEAGTGREVSNRAETYFSVANALPPVLNQPLNGSELSLTRPQNVLLQWTPRHTSTASNMITYQVKICEVAEDEEPNVAINSSQTCFTVPQQTGTTYLIKPSDLPLQSGKRYAWQVQVSDINGALEFQNAGNSEVAWFRYGKACTAPEQPELSEIGPNRVNLSWEADPQALGYKVYYKNETATDWLSQSTLGTSLTIIGLDLREPYSFKISTLCDIDNESPTSPEISWEAEAIDTELQDLIDEVLNPLNQIYSSGSPSPANPVVPDPKSPTAQAANDPLPKSLTDLIPTDPTKIPCVGQVRGYGNCSDSHTSVILGGTDPLENLKVGDPLTIYDMLAIVTEIDGKGGVFSGKALVKMPMLNDLMMGVEFSNVEIKASKPVDKGGCVTLVPGNGYFRTRANLSPEDLKAEEIALIDKIRKKQDPTSTYVSFGQQITQYTSTTQAIATAQAAGQPISQALKDALLAQTTALKGQLNTWLAKADELIGGTESGNAILNQIKALIDQLTANEAAIAAGTGYPSVPNLTSPIGGITDQIKTLLNTPSTLPPTIKNVVAKNITDNAATLTWEGDKRFTKYIVTLQKPGEGERIFEVTGTKLELEGLVKESDYVVTVKGKIGTEISNSSIGSYFTTLKTAFPKPINLKVEYMGEGNAKITWDKNPLHVKYKLKYTDKAGNIKYAYPTKNEISLFDLINDDFYKYELVAFSKTSEISDPAFGDFESPSICIRFRNLIASTKELLQGEPVTLTAPYCQSDIKWYVNNVLTYISGQSHTFTPSLTTTFRVTCDITDPEYKIGRYACETSTTVLVNKKCLDVSVSASPNSVVLGNSVLLRAKNCEGEIQWYDNFPNGAIIAENIKTLIVTPLPNKQYSLSCIEVTGSVCFVKAPNIIIDCNLQVVPYNEDLNFKKFTKYHDYTLKAIGCQYGEVAWEIEGGNKNVASENLPDNKLLVKDVRGYKDVNVTAKCIVEKSILCETQYQINGNKDNCDFDFTKQKIVFFEDKVELFYSGSTAKHYKWDDLNSTIDIKRNVPLPTLPVVYTATVNIKPEKYTLDPDLGCKMNFVLEPKIKTDNSSGIAPIECIPFIATASKYTITRGEPITFQTKGCEDETGNKGVVEWDKVLPTDGKVLETATFTATCTFVGEKIESKIAINVKDPVFVVKVSNIEIVQGEEIIFEVSGCTSGYPNGTGTITWFNGNTIISEKGSIKIKPTETKTYIITCQLPGKIIQEKAIKVIVKNIEIYKIDPCNFILSTISIYSYSNPASSSPVDINFSGCIGSTVQWKTLTDDSYLKQFGYLVGGLNLAISANKNVTVTYQFTCTNQNGSCSKNITIYRDPKNKPQTIDINISTICNRFNTEYKVEIKNKEAPGISSSSTSSQYIPYNSKTDGVSAEKAGDKLVLKNIECYNLSGIESWYLDKGLSRPIYIENNQFVVALPGIDKTETYYTKCVLKEKTCSASLVVKNITSAGARLGTESEDISGTLDGNLETEDPPQANCGFISSQKALGDMLKSIICENVELFLEKPLTTEKLEIVKNTILQQPIFSNSGITLPPISDAMFLELTADKNKCKAAIEDLAKDVEGTSLRGDFNTLVSQGGFISDILDENEAIKNSELVTIKDNRTSETFDWLEPIIASIPNARIANTEIKVCANYQFDPTGRRISISGISNCDLSPNGILRGFTLNNKNYLALYNLASKRFLGYYEEGNFNSKADANGEVNIDKLETDATYWIKSIDNLPEDDNINRIRQFLTENQYILKNKELLPQVLNLLEQVPESVFKVVEGEGSVFKFRLDDLLTYLQKIVAGANLSSNIINILDDPTKGNDTKTCAIYEYYKSLNDPSKQIGLNASLDIETRKKLIALLAKGALTYGISPIGPCTITYPGESIVLELIRTTPVNKSTDDVGKLLSFLNEPTANPLLETLISKIDYGDIVNAITYIEKRDDAAIRLYDKVFSTLESGSIEEIEKHNFYLPSGGLFGKDFVGKPIYKFSYDNGKVKVTKSIITEPKFELKSDGEGNQVLVQDGWKYSPEITYNLNPYDLVNVINTTGLSAIENDLGINNGDFAYVPAITLAYAAQKQLNHDIIQTINLASVFVGAGLSINAVRAGATALAIFEAAGVVGAGLQFGIGTGDIPPAYSDIIGFYNACVGFGGIGLVAGQNLPKLGALILRVKNSVTPININRATALNFLKRLSTLKASPQWATINLATKENLLKLANYLASKGLSATETILDPVFYTNLAKLATYNNLKKVAIIPLFVLLQKTDIDLATGFIRNFDNVAESRIVLAEGGKIGTSIDAFETATTFASKPNIAGIINQTTETAPGGLGKYLSAADIENPAAWQSVANSAIEMTQLETATHTVILLGSSTLGFVAFAQKKPADACDICIETTRKPICAILKALHTRGGGSAVLKGQIQKKLCESKKENNTIAALATELTAFSSTEINAFMTDLSINCSGTNLCKDNVTADIAEAWKVLYSRKDHRKSIEYLNQVKTMLANAKIQNNLNLGSDTHKDVLKAVITNHIDRVGVQFGGSTALLQYLKGLEKVINEFDGKTGFKESLPPLKVNTLQAFDGIWFSIKAMQEIDASNVVKVDMEFDEDQDCGTASNPASCKYDLETSGSPRFYEFKSYKVSTSGFPKFSQLKAYFGRIRSMNDLVYYFEKRFSKVQDEVEVKTVLQKLLCTNCHDATATAKTLSTKGSELFEVIWGNNIGLRESLWDDIPINPDEEDKNDYKVKFGDIVSSTSNNFFNFIKVK